jgi:hypothetical protein
MRLSTLTLALPALASAAEPAQKPLTDQVSAWFEKAKSYIPNYVEAPLDAGAASVASNKLVKLTTQNWPTALAPSYHHKTGNFGPDTWMVLVTGSNKTCAGNCEPLEVDFNKTVALLGAEKNPPKFGIINCDLNPVLCNTWLAGVPSLWYIQRPEKVVDGAPDEHKETPIHVVRLNVTETTTKDLVAIHKDKTYLNWQKVDSYFHPFDGELVQWGLQRPLGYALYIFNNIPSWGMMLAVSFMTRQFM